MWSDYIYRERGIIPVLSSGINCTHHYSLSDCISLAIKLFLYSLIVFTVPFHLSTTLSNCIPFKCTAMSNSCICPIDRTFQVLTLRARMDQGAIGMKEYFAFPEAPALPGFISRSFNLKIRTLVGRGLMPLQRYNRYILQPQPTGLKLIDWMNEC